MYAIAERILVFTKAIVRAGDQGLNPALKAQAIRQASKKIDVLLRHEEINAVDRILRRGRRIVVSDSHLGGVVRAHERSDRRRESNRERFVTLDMSIVHDGNEDRLARFTGSETERACG